MMYPMVERQSSIEQQSSQQQQPHNHHQQPQQLQGEPDRRPSSSSSSSPPPPLPPPHAAAVEEPEIVVVRYHAVEGRPHVLHQRLQGPVRAARPQGRIQQQHQEEQQEPLADGEQAGGEQPESGEHHHRHRRRRPLIRRVFNYVREAWTGVKSALDSELEDLETPPRYRPDSLEALSKATRFTQAEIKRIYRGFKAECPTGVVKEDTFKMIYAQFFPQGANSSQYAHYVFNTLDQDHSGLISFEDFVQNLSILSRGSLEEKLRWAFTLYDINGDGAITKEEMTDIVSAVYDLMGKLAEPSIEEDTVKEKVDRIFQKMDKNKDGVVTLDEFLECCQMDGDISSSMAVFDSSF